MNFPLGFETSVRISRFGANAGKCTCKKGWSGSKCQQESPTVNCQNVSSAEVRSLLEIPDPWATHACVPMGWPVGGGHGPLSRRPLEEAAYLDRFGESLG